MNEEKIKNLSDKYLLQQYKQDCIDTMGIPEEETVDRVEIEEQELLSRLSKNSVEDYKKRLVKEIEKNWVICDKFDENDELGVKHIGYYFIKKLIDNIK